MTGKYVAGLLTILATLAGCAGGGDDGPPDRLELTDGWQYRWGDSPVDESGLPLWRLDSADSSEWHDVDIPIDAPGRDGRDYLWLRVPLPASVWEDPAFFLTMVMGAFEAYVGGERVYVSGRMGEPQTHGYDALQWHMFGLPRLDAGGTLHLRVYSAGSHIGVPLMADNKALYGSEQSLLRYVVLNSMDRFVLGSLFLLLGLLALDYHHHRRDRSEHHYIAFGLFSASTGLAFGLSAEVAQFLVPSAAIRLSIAQIGLYFFPVGLFCFCEQIAQHGEEGIFRRLWQICAVVAFVALVLQFSGLVTQYMILFLAWGLVLGLSFVMGIGLSIRGAARGNVEARIFYLGLIATLGFVIHDLLWSFDIIPYWHYLSQWGILLFLLALVHIVERRNAADQRRLAEYSHRLQEYSAELEDRVAERTRDLQDKNAALEQTMGELRDAQTQLVMREKMASLGNLVAGVAHEINNPVGAIRGAADVIRRAVAHLGRTGAEETDRGRALTTLETNSAVVDEASQRVARIVRTLKDFAELDEAAYQQGVDVREALDNVLVLLESRLAGGITVVREYEEVPLIGCYAGELKQAFMNILLNAVEAVGGGDGMSSGGDGSAALGDRGTITVRAHSRGEGESGTAGDGVVVQISDTGRGIPPAEIEHIFDPGFTTKGTGVGTGLGLSTTYRTVQKHGGTIEARSDGRTGTTVTISLPLVAAA